MNKKLILLLVLFLPLISGAVDIGGTESQGVVIEREIITFDNNTAYVNASDKWITNIGDLKDANLTQFDSGGDSATLNLKESWLTIFGNNLWCKLIGCTMEGDINIDSNEIHNIAFLNLTQDVTLNPFNWLVPSPTLNNHTTNKKYVDDATASTAFDFFFNNESSNIGGHFNMTENDLELPESELDSASLGEGTFSIFNWTTLVGQPEFNELRQGVYDVHVHLKVDSTGRKPVTITPKLYNISADGAVRNLLITFETTPELTIIPRPYELHGVLTEPIMLSNGERLNLELEATVGATGAPVTVTVEMEGTTDSHLTVETSSNAFEKIFIRRDGTNTLTGNWNFGSFNIEGTGNATSNYFFGNGSQLTGLPSTPDGSINSTAWNRSGTDVILNGADSVNLKDNQKLYLGDADDVSINFNGSQTQFTNEVGSGDFIFNLNGGAFSVLSLLLINPLDTFIGSDAGKGNIGVNNLGIGFNSLGGFSTGTTGVGNTGIGINALRVLKGGNNNVGIGSGALIRCSAVGCTNNVGIGSNALSNTIDDGGNNVGIGFNALLNCDSDFNVGIGVQALGNVATGDNDNVGIGYFAGRNLQSPGSVAIGSRALYDQQNGYNVGIGFRAGYESQLSSSDVIVGSYAGYNKRYGGSNTIIGSSAGYQIGGINHFENNVMLGFQTGYTAVGNNSIFLGYQSGYYETADNKLMIDNIQRASEADARVKALIVGDFASTSDAQNLTFNANVNITEDLVILGNLTIDKNLIVGGCIQYNCSDGCITLGSCI